MVYKKEEIAKLFKHQKVNDTFILKDNYQNNEDYLEYDDCETEFYSDDVVLEDVVFATEDKEVEITDEDLDEYLNKKYEKSKSKKEEVVDIDLENELPFGCTVKKSSPKTVERSDTDDLDIEYPKDYNDNYVEFDDCGIGDASVQENDEEWLKIAQKLDII